MAPWNLIIIGLKMAWRTFGAKRLLTIYFQLDIQEPIQKKEE